MRVLFVTPRFPGTGARGDQSRAFQQIRHLSRRHAITLLTCGAPRAGSASAGRMQSLCEHVMVLPRPRLATLARVLAASAGQRPWQTTLFDAWPTDPALDAVLAAGRFDLAHVQMVRLAGMLPRLAPLPCVFDLVDALSSNMARRAEFDRGPWRMLAAREAPRLLQLERRLCVQAAATTISSAADSAAIGGPGAPQLVPNGVDLERFPFVPARQSMQVVFAGNLGYFPNVDAACWVAREVLPLVRARLPAAELVLLGVDPAPALRRLAASVPGVRLVGAVPDMHPHLAAAGVALSPLRAGSGQQLKLLEAMAAGTPAIATPLSAAGIDARHGTHLLVADGPAAMAAAVERLLTDRPFAGALAQAARALVASRYTWEHSTAALEQVWFDAAGMGSARRPAVANA